MVVRRSIRRLVYWIAPPLVLIGGWQVWDAAEARRLSAQLAQMFPDGIDRPAVRTQANDAAAYYAAVNLTAVSAAQIASLDDPANPPPPLRPLVMRYRTALSAGQPPAAADVETLARVLSAYELPLRLIRDGSTRPYGRDADITQGSYRFSGFLSIGDVLSAHTLDLVRTGPADAAVESVISRVKLLRAYAPSDGAFAASLKAMQSGAIAMDAGVVLSRMTPSDDALARLEQALADAYDDDEIEHFMRADARMSYQVFESFATGRRVETSRAVVMARPGLRHLLTDGLQTAQEIVAAAGRPWPERLHAIERLDDRHSPLVLFLVRPFVPRMGLRSLWPIADQASGMALAIAGGVANARVAHMAVSLARDRVSADSLDPFTGKALRYIRSAGEVTVYSVGRDFRDDGGAVTPVPAKGQSPGYAQSPDIGIRVRLPSGL